MKTIDFNGSHSETIKYDNLPDGIYYLFETDENGVPYAMGETHTEKDRTYKCVVGDGSGDSADNKVQLQGRPQGKNIFAVFNYYRFHQLLLLFHDWLWICFITFSFYCLTSFYVYVSFAAFAACYAPDCK